jgi:hypothetical protein
MISKPADKVSRGKACLSLRIVAETAFIYLDFLKAAAEWAHVAFVAYMSACLAEK